MKKCAFLFIFIITFTLLSLNAGEKIKKDIHYFIKKAWDNNSTIKQARYDIEKYKNMQLEAISVYTPKINGITWLAPMYTVKSTGEPYQTISDFNTWGPYYNLDLQFQQPVFTFSRVYSGIKAAQEGQNVARADVEVIKWNVAKEVRLYYYGIIFGLTMLKTIDMADEMLTQAIETAQDGIKKGKAEATTVDISKLKYFYSMIPTNRAFVQKSIMLAQEAIYLTTGEKFMPDDMPEKFEVEKELNLDFAHNLDLMLKNKPLLKKLNAGINATKHLVDLEYKSMLPAVFIGGFLKFTAAPTVDMHYNRFLSNAYNTTSQSGRSVDGGIAMGLFWQFDPVKSVARALQKQAELDKLLEMHKYAMGGFPVQLKKVLADIEEVKVKIDVLKGAIDNAETWMFFSANSYAFGDGEARDILEGLAAYVKAKTDYYQAVYDYNKLIGELTDTVGVDVAKE